MTWLMYLTLASLLLTLVFQIIGARALRKPPPLPGPAYPISVLKPLKGVDEGLYENLRSIVTQDYPAFEVLFGAEDPSDPALSVARQLQREFPLVDIRIVDGFLPFGYNPKVTNVRALARAAKYDTVLISDSNVRVPRDYLQRLNDCYTEDSRVGLVASHLVGVGERSFGALLENLHLNGYAATIAAAATIARHPCVIGKSMLFSLREFERIGGFHSVKDVLSEDYVIGCKFQAEGHRVVISPHLVPVVHRHRSLRAFWDRHLRWAQMRFRIQPLPYLGEILLNPTLFAAGLVAAFAAAPDERTRFSGLLVGCLSLWVRAMTDLEFSRSMRHHPVGLVGLPAVCIKDLILAGAWIVGMLKRSVVWRGQRLLIGGGAQLHAIEAPAMLNDGPQPAKERA